MLAGQQVFSSLCMCVHAKNDKYNLEKKQNLVKLCFEIQVRSRSRAKEALGPEKKTHVAPSLSFKSKAAREFFSFIEEHKV